MITLSRSTSFLLYTLSSDFAENSARFLFIISILSGFVAKWRSEIRAGGFTSAIWYIGAVLTGMIKNLLDIIQFFTNPYLYRKIMSANDYTKVYMNLGEYDSISKCRRLLAILIGQLGKNFADGNDTKIVTIICILLPE